MRLGRVDEKASFCTENFLGVSVSETIDAHVAVNGRGPLRRSGRDRAFRPVVSDTDTPKKFGALRHESLYIIGMVGDDVGAQDAAAGGGDQDVILEADATEVAVLLDFVVVEEVQMHFL